MTKRIAAIVLTLMLLAGAFSGVFRSVAYARELGKKITAEKNALTAVRGMVSSDKVTIMVELSGEPAIKRADSNVKGALDYVDALKNEQKKAKKTIENTLCRGIEIKNSYTLLFNGFSFEGTADMISEINKNEGITAFAAPVYNIPEMLASTELVGATEMWDMGYTGKGTAVAVIDTGIYADHEAFSVNPPSPKFTEQKLEKIFEQYGEYMHAGSKVRKLYESAKIPFAYDYYSDKYGAEHIGESDHGTHVAGIAAGNNGKEFKGVAYDAQIFAMQVFTPEGGATGDAILAALEDCVYLGVDSINMSLGSPAGYSIYSSDVMERIYNALEDAGIPIAAAAGNEGSTADGNAWGGYAITDTPDTGTVGSPSTYPAALSVASSDNATVCSGSIKVGDGQFGYADPFKGTDLAFETLAGQYEYVLCGFGQANEFEGIDLKGKIAVIQRGSITFTEKAGYAAENGAVGVIIYNNQSGIINMSIESIIPAVSILQEDGQKLVDAAKDGKGRLEIVKGTYIDYTSANSMSSFSSRGTTTNLQIKPEITAPGGSITSCVGFGNTDSYETWNGTSMSTPHVAGGLAVLKQYVAEKFPSKTPQEQLEIVYAILMSTATQLEGDLVREQGAGLMNLQGAFTTSAYLMSKDNSRPKMELGEVADGILNLEFKVTNFGTQQIKYNLKTEVDIDTPYALGTYGEYTVYATDFDALDITEDCDVKADKTITVAAGKTVTVKVKVTMHEDLLADIASLFPNGTFAEGFVTLTPEATSEGVQEATLSIPFLGYVGDWSVPGVIDDGYYWQDATGDYNWYSNGEIDYNYIGYADDEDLMYGAGINPYGDGTMDYGTFSYDRIAVSPGKSDINYIMFSLLRNARSVNLYLKDDEGNVIENLTNYDDYMWKKEYNSDNGYTYSDLDIDIDYQNFYDNDRIHIVLETVLDYTKADMTKNKNGSWDVPVTIDRTAPFVTSAKITNSILTVKAFDTNYIAYMAVYRDAQMQDAIYESLYNADVRAHTEELKAEIDAADKGILYVKVADYAQNERVYIFRTDDNSLTENTMPEELFGKVDVWSETFEYSYSFNNWDVLDVDGDGKSWGTINDKNLAAEGKTFAASESYSETNPTTPINWLISPYVSIPDTEDTYELSFRIAATGYAENYAFSILVGENGEYEIVDQLIYAKISGSNYRTVTVDVSEYAGQSIRFGWAHANSAGHMIRLDDIHLYYKDAFVNQTPVSRESFEGTTSWKTEDKDGNGKSFMLIENENMATDGKKAMYSYSVDLATLKPYDTDDWLLSDGIKISNAPELTYLVFDAISPMNLDDEIEVYAGTSQSADKMNALLYKGSADTDWSEITINLSAYAGKTIYIGIRHTAKEGYAVGIDNVRFYTQKTDLEYMVTFRDTVTNSIVGMQRVKNGETVKGMPYSPDYETKVFTGWKYDNTPITKDTVIDSIYVLRGDCNRNDVINTADAVIILKWCAGILEPTRVDRNVGDYNMDDALNTGDAVAILRFAAGMD